jgi:thioredoxin-related protein
MKSIIIVAFIMFLTTPIYCQEVKWHTIEEAIELSKKKPRKMVVDVYTDWCGWCKVMDKNTFGNKIIADYLNKNYYPVKFNAEQKENVTIGDKTYKFVAQGRRGYHELAAVLLNGNMGYPSVVFLDEQIRIIQPFQGYIKAKRFDAISRFIGDEHYKNQTWEEFMAEYKSPIAEE